MTKFGELLKHYRVRSNMSQSRLAEIAGVDKSYISRLEKGERKVLSRSLAIKIAELLNLSHDETEIWLISGGYVSPRFQKLVDRSGSKLIEMISLLDEG